MQAKARRRVDIAAWVGACHPWPTVVVVSLTTLIGVASARGEVDAGRLGLLALTMLGCQLAVGWSNDYLDRDTDRLHQPSKPLAAGRLPAESIAVSTVVALAGALAGGAMLGRTPLLLLIGGTAAGLAYNLGLKNTPWSWLPYVVGFALLPLFAWSSLGIFETRFLWLYPIALPLTLAAHIANALPDAAADASAGGGGSVVRLGVRRSLIVLAACVALPLALVLITLPFVTYDAAVLLGTLTAYKLLLAGVALSCAGERYHAAFRFASLAALVFVVGWLAAV